MERFAPQLGAFCSSAWSILLHRLERFAPQLGAICSTAWSNPLVPHNRGKRLSGVEISGVEGGFEVILTL
jgi:hypothetical protein